MASIFGHHHHRLPFGNSVSNFIEQIDLLVLTLKQDGIPMRNPFLIGNLYRGSPSPVNSPRTPDGNISRSFSRSAEPGHDNMFIGENNQG